MCSDSYPILILSLFFLYHPYIPYILIQRFFLSSNVQLLWEGLDVARDIVAMSNWEQLVYNYANSVCTQNLCNLVQRFSGCLQRILCIHICLSGTLLVCTCAVYTHYSFPNSKSTIKLITPEPVKRSCFVGVFSSSLSPCGTKCCI